MKKLKKAALGKAMVTKKPKKKGYDLSAYPDADYDLLPLTVDVEGAPKVSNVVPPQTFRKVYHNGRKSFSLCTVMPNGLRVGWDNCGGCHNHISMCRCGAGVSADRSIEYIFDQITAKLAGEEWDHNHKRYKQGSLYDLRRGRRVAELDARDAARNAGRKALKKKVEDPKRLLKKASTPLREEAFDAKKLGKIAREVADDAEKTLNRRLKKLEGAGLDKKPLTKGLRKTKLLRSSK